MNIRRTLRNQLDVLLLAAQRLDGELVIAPPIPGVGEQWTASLLLGPEWSRRSVVGRGATGREALAALYDLVEKIA